MSLYVEASTHWIRFHSASTELTNAKKRKQRGVPVVQSVLGREMGTSACAKRNFCPIADNLGFQNCYDRIMPNDGSNNECNGAQKDNRRSRVRTFLAPSAAATSATRLVQAAEDRIHNCSAQATTRLMRQGYLFLNASLDRIVRHYSPFTITPPGLELPSESPKLSRPRR